MLLRHPQRVEHERTAASARRARPELVLLAAGLAFFMTDLDFFALNLALPTMSSDLDVAPTDLQWVISGFMLALAASLIPGGRLADILGRRTMLIVGVLIFSGASAICGSVSSAELVVGFRILQGVGAGIIAPVAVAVVTTAFPDDRRKRAIGNLYGIAAVATALGPFVGGLLTDALTWRWVFWVNVPLGLLVVLVILRAVPETRDESAPRRIDLPGLIAVTLGIAAATYAVDRGEEWGWTSAATIVTLAAGLALLGAFVAIERRVRWPLVDLALFRNQPYVAVTLAGMVANVAFVVTTFASTLYLQQVRDLSPLAAGAVFLAASGTLAVAGPVSGRLGERFDVPRLMLAAIMVGAAGLLVVAADSDLAVYVPALAAVGAGLGLCWSLTSIGTQTVVPPQQAGAASGVTLAAVIGIAGLAVAIVAAAIDAIVGGGTGEGEAIESILRVIAIGSALAALAIGFALRQVRRHASVPG